jgi:hypothetical protein
MYVFAIMGFYFFAEGNPEQWGSLGRAFFSLFTFVRAGADRVAVAGWKWDRWKERTSAVRMVLVGDSEND